MRKFALLDSNIVGIRTAFGNLILELDDIKRPYIEISPENAKFDNLVISPSCGFLTIDAIKWLYENNKSLLILNFKGDILTEIHPFLNTHHVSIVRKAQYLITEEQKYYLSSDILNTKISRFLYMLDFLQQNFNKDFSFEKESIIKQRSKIEKMNDSKSLLTIESGCNFIYWKAVKQCLNEKWKFEARSTRMLKLKNQRSPKDQFNTFLNYGYTILASQLTRACFATGFDPYYSFFHWSNLPYKKFIYDIIEPFRFLIDKTLIENQEELLKLNLKKAPDKTYYLSPETKTILFDFIDETFNEKVRYKNKNYPWAGIFTLKLTELARYLSHKQNYFSFAKPEP